MTTNNSAAIAAQAIEAQKGAAAPVRKIAMYPKDLEAVQTERPPVLTHFQKLAAIQSVIDFIGATGEEAFFSAHQIDENRIMIFGHGGNEEDWTPVYTLTDMNMEQALSIINTACEV